MFPRLFPLHFFPLFFSLFSIHQYISFLSLSSSFTLLILSSLPVDSFYPFPYPFPPLPFLPFPLSPFIYLLRIDLYGEVIKDVCSLCWARPGRDSAQ